MKTSISAVSESATASTGHTSSGEKDFLANLPEPGNDDPPAPADPHDRPAAPTPPPSLAGITTANATLEQIAQRLDTLIAEQKAREADRQRSRQRRTPASRARRARWP